MKLEVVVIPVSDVDRAKRFYESLGWRLDADFATGDNWRVVQMTPPGSACSIIFGKGITTAAPGSVQGLLLIVDDIEAARAELIGHGVDVSEVFHFEGGLHVTGTHGRVPGPDPEGRSYRSWVSFNDPDGNGWLLQEIKTRLPGRGLSSMDVATLTELLREARSATATTKRPLRSTTGRGGTPPTSSRASAAGLPRKQPKMLRSTWKVPADEACPSHCWPNRTDQRGGRTRPPTAARRTFLVAGSRQRAAVSHKSRSLMTDPWGACQSVPSSSRLHGRTWGR